MQEPQQTKKIGKFFLIHLEIVKEPVLEFLNNLWMLGTE
jgi:hypothetical protein